MRKFLLKIIDWPESVELFQFHWFKFELVLSYGFGIQDKANDTLLSLKTELGDHTKLKDEIWGLRTLLVKPTLTNPEEQQDQNFEYFHNCHIL